MCLQLAKYDSDNSDKEKFFGDSQSFLKVYKGALEQNVGMPITTQNENLTL